MGKGKMMRKRRRGKEGCEREKEAREGIQRNGKDYGRERRVVGGEERLSKRKISRRAGRTEMEKSKQEEEEL